MSDTSKAKEKTNELEIGEGAKVTMDSFVEILLKQLFENDNDTSTLTVVLGGEGFDTPATVMFTLTLHSINGVKTRSAA